MAFLFNMKFRIKKYVDTEEQSPGPHLQEPHSEIITGFKPKPDHHLFSSRFHQDVHGTHIPCFLVVVSRQIFYFILFL